MSHHDEGAERLKRSVSTSPSSVIDTIAQEMIVVERTVYATMIEKRKMIVLSIFHSCAVFSCLRFRPGGAAAVIRDDDAISRILLLYESDCSH